MVGNRVYKLNLLKKNKIKQKKKLNGPIFNSFIWFVPLEKTSFLDCMNRNKVITGSL